MDERSVQKSFDDKERALVRDALRRYMKEHQIGVPALMERIVTADEPRHREIPLSTLQRLIAGKHRTADHHVALCHVFVKDLPYYGEDSKIRMFGEAFAKFFVLHPQHWFQPDDTDDLCGVFTGQTALSEIYPEGAATGAFYKFGDFSISRDKGAQYYQVREIVTYPRANTPAQEKTGAFYSYEGVMIVYDHAIKIRMLLRNCLTREPRVYELTEVAPGRLKGSVEEISSLSERTEDGRISYPCEIYPRKLN